jgi:amino-acid N-acetyltransferase
MEVSIDRADARDAEDLEALLRLIGLPVDGLLDHLGTAIVARRSGRIVGSAALEIYADGALLRSVAVAPDLQGGGVGARLTRAALQLARERGVEAVYLLTTTAEMYFPRFGFEKIGRDETPAGVRTSVEFRSACPSTATVMRLRP